MRVRVEPTAFARQCEEHQLRFCCDDCAFFMPPQQCCAHGWPTVEHRQALYERSDLSEVVFCKEFELR